MEYADPTFCQVQNVGRDALIPPPNVLQPVYFCMHHVSYDIVIFWVYRDWCINCLVYHDWCIQTVWFTVIGLNKPFEFPFRVYTNRF